MPPELRNAEADNGVVWFALPIGIGIALGLFGGPHWLRLAGATAVCFAFANILFQSSHFLHWRAYGGSSVAAYFGMRLLLDAIKIGVPIAVVFAVKGAPFKVGARTPWEPKAKMAYVARCSDDMITQGMERSYASSICSCLAGSLEAEFGVEEYTQMMAAQPRRNGTGVERRLNEVLSACLIPKQESSQ